MADENWVVDMHRGWSNREGEPNVDTVWVLAFRIEDGKIREARNFSFDQAAADAFFWQAYPLKPLARSGWRTEQRMRARPHSLRALELVAPGG